MMKGSPHSGEGRWALATGISENIYEGLANESHMTHQTSSCHIFEDEPGNLPGTLNKSYGLFKLIPLFLPGFVSERADSWSILAIEARNAMHSSI
jgi:hypothetical protein